MMGSPTSPSPSLRDWSEQQLQARLRDRPGDAWARGGLALLALRAGERERAAAMLEGAGRAAGGEAAGEEGAHVGGAEGALAEAGSALLAHIEAWLALQSGAPQRALNGLDSITVPTADTLYLRGCAHEALALKGDTPAARRGSLEAALATHQALLRGMLGEPSSGGSGELSNGAGDELSNGAGGELSNGVSGEVLRGGLMGVASPAKAWLRVATVLLLLAEMERAGQALTTALQLAADSREAKLLAAEYAIVSGKHQQGMRQVLPLLDERPDGWVLAALAAYGGQLTEQMARLVSEARSRLPSGFLAPHRRERWQDACALLDLSRAEPQPGQGPYGQLGALMCGAYERVPAGGVRGADRALVEAQLRVLLLAGRTDLLVPLLDKRANALLPGIGELVRGVVGGIAGHLPQP